MVSSKSTYLILNIHKINIGIIHCMYYKYLSKKYTYYVCKLNLPKYQISKINI